MASYGNSLVALDARTGEKTWYRQLVRYDLWDYDLAAPPPRCSTYVKARVIPAVAEITKMGPLFVFDHVTGEPVFGIEERPVPQTTIPHEVTAKPHPFRVKPRSLAKNRFHLEEIYHRSREHAQFCKELFAANHMEIGPPYTRRRSKEMRCSSRALWAAAIGQACPSIRRLDSYSSM
jgi:quinoprotein glucose dehydrogenase